MNQKRSMRVKLTDAEKQFGTSRLQHAEGLISQLPNNHEGRNTWLMNYGRSAEAVKLRNAYGLVFDSATQAAK